MVYSIYYMYIIYCLYLNQYKICKNIFAIVASCALYYKVL